MNIKINFQQIKMKLKILNLEEYSYLKDSDFYKSISKEDEEDEIDVIFCSIHEEDVILFLDVINFWGVNFRPPEFFKLVFKVKPSKKLLELYKITKSELYAFLLQHLNYKRNFCNRVIDHGYLDLLNYTYVEKMEWDESLCRNAVRTGRIDILRFLYEKGCPYHKESLFSVCKHDYMFEYIENSMKY